MTLQERIVKDLKDALKNQKEDYEKYSSLKVIVGELQRQTNKVLSDEEVINILKKLQKYENEKLALSSGNVIAATIDKKSEYLNIVESYLPKQVSEKEIIKWITENVDFSKLKGKFQAVGIVKNEFKNTISASIVKRIISEKF